ncbi:hypothetical protein ACQ86B_06105 [Mycolicibacterium aichiense]|uniref:hypothetical protein n=1 Tax=Mycolicibacterium aichiense TaxID=1799 RepID=UPI003D66A415
MKVDPIALRTLAVTCERWSGELAATSAPQNSGVTSQATAAAVAAVHADAGQVSARFAERMQSTASALAEGSVGYAIEDESSARQLTDVTMDL